MKKKEPAIDMARYNDSEAVVPECEGCERVFEHIQVLEEGEFPVITDKCLAYPVPAAKWPRKDETFAMRTVTVRERDEKGKPTLVQKDIPVVIKACPLATHYTMPEIVDTNIKTRAGQQRHA